jgi:carboxyl-terminal processing protease
MKYHTRLIACSLLFLSPAIGLAGSKPAPKPQQSPTAISPGAAEFLDNAIDIMREHALHGQDVDWTALRVEAFKRAGGAFNPIDTYPAIYWALVQLKDPGSHLRLPPGLYPDQIALLQQAEKEAASSAPGGARAENVPTPFATRRLPEGHIVTAQGRNYGYVVLPRCTAKDNDGLLLYAADVRRILTDLSGQSPSGWIVDLRGNTGGNMWPMLTGIGPILGDGPVGSFVAADGNVTWFYQEGKTGTRNPAGLETVSLSLDDAPIIMKSAPVAVLVDNSTASSAEAITIAFHGRPDTRFFGTPTAGKSTAVQPFKLDDGAEIYLTTAIDADRTGKAYPDGFTPDQIVSSSGSSIPQESNDPVIVAAQTWLVATTTPIAPPTPAPPTYKGRRKKATLAAASSASPSPASSSTVAQTTAVTPPVTPAVVPAPAAASPAPAAAAPAPAAAAPTTANAAVPETGAPASAPAQDQVASTTPAVAATPAKPKVHKKVVVHQGS